MEGQEELSTIMSGLETKGVISAELLAKVDGKIVKVDGSTIATAQGVQDAFDRVGDNLKSLQDQIGNKADKEYVDGMIGDVESLLAAL